MIQIGPYKNIKKTFQNEYKDRNVEYRNKLTKWSSELQLVRVGKPTNIPELGSLATRRKKGLTLCGYAFMAGAVSHNMVMLFFSV
ncbi:MAG: hypothetical protein QXL16_02775, partial [Candidatus Micrarchaeaceae archaeon]